MKLTSLWDAWIDETGLVDGVAFNQRATLVPCQISVEGRELRFRGGQAALRYSLMTPPRTRFRRTGASIAMTTLGS